ncbi:hypothetical protein Tco_0163914 [Tanacetum coccineum]
MRMEQYLQCIDYTLWKIVENGNAPIVTKTVDGKETVIPPTSVEEKAQRRAELKARSTLFGGNSATKKTQKNLLKQQYENFTASSTEVIEQTYERLQKLISQLEMHGKVIPQEDINQNLDELFNDLKAYESEVNETSNSTTNSHNVAFLSSSSSNSATGAVNTTQGVNIVSTQGATDSSTTIENLVMLDGLEVEYCYVDYEGKKIPEEYWKESGDLPTRKNFRHPEIKTVGVGSLPEGLSSSSTNSEVSNDSNCCSSCLECVKDLKEQNEQLVKDLRTAKVSDVSYKTGLESVEARLKLELATKEKDEVQLTVQKFENSSKSLSKILKSQIMDKCKIGLGYNVVPPPYTGNFMPPKPDLVYPSLDDFVEVNESVSESIVEEPTGETNEPKNTRKENRALIIKDWG